MTVWRYRAADGDSELLEGEIEAADETGAASRLQAAGLMPLRLRPVAAQKAAAPTERRGRPLKLATLAATASQTAVLLGSGLALDEALDLAADFSQRPREAEILRTLLDRIRSGASLAEAMTAEQGVFPDFAV